MKKGEGGNRKYRIGTLGRRNKGNVGKQIVALHDTEWQALKGRHRLALGSAQRY